MEQLVTSEANEVINLRLDNERVVAVDEVVLAICVIRAYIMQRMWSVRLFTYELERSIHWHTANCSHESLRGAFSLNLPLGSRIYGRIVQAGLAYFNVSPEVIRKLKYDMLSGDEVDPDATYMKDKVRILKALTASAPVVNVVLASIHTKKYSTQLSSINHEIVGKTEPDTSYDALDRIAFFQGLDLTKAESTVAFGSGGVSVSLGIAKVATALTGSIIPPAHDDKTLHNVIRNIFYITLNKDGNITSVHLRQSNAA